MHGRLPRPSTVSAAPVRAGKCGCRRRIGHGCRQWKGGGGAGFVSTGITPVPALEEATPGPVVGVLWGTVEHPQLDLLQQVRPESGLGRSLSPFVPPGLWSSRLALGRHKASFFLGGQTAGGPPFGGPGGDSSQGKQDLSSLALRPCDAPIPPDLSPPSPLPPLSSHSVPPRFSQPPPPLSPHLAPLHSSKPQLPLCPHHDSRAKGHQNEQSTKGVCLSLFLLVPPIGALLLPVSTPEQCPT